MANGLPYRAELVSDQFEKFNVLSGLVWCQYQLLISQAIHTFMDKPNPAAWRMSFSTPVTLHAESNIVEKMFTHRPRVKA